MEPVLFPLRVDFGQELSVEWSFKTEIFQTREGEEYRRAQRDKPRYSIQFAVAEGREKSEVIRSILAKAKGSLMVAPDYTRRLVVDPRPSGENKSVVLGQETPYWMRTGRWVAVSNRKETFLRKIESTVNDVLVMDEPVRFTGTEVFHPARLGRLQQDQRMIRLSAGSMRATFVFSEDPTSEIHPVDPLVLEAGMFYRGYPVLTIPPNWSSAPEEVVSRDVDLIDFDYGSIFIRPLHSEASWATKYNVSVRAAAETEWFTDFFCRRRGQQGLFYIPSQTADLSVEQKISETEIVVAGTHAAAVFAESFIYRNLAFIGPKNAMVLSGVVKAVVEGESTRIVLDNPVPNEFAYTKISWLFMARFASDQLSVRWITDQVAEFAINVQVVRERLLELQISGDRIGFGYDYVTMGAPVRPTLLRALTIDGERILLSGEYLI